ncbi:hypothetical protein MKW94_024694 [Papaver nudicaule]|uniref:FACT complex subunit n=1 Tax=Papaver nudicaule TaxID=74823 RepID=A0AA41VCV3_PAPNU|nr:hypothetical protein [Papaver nudicaule]
MLDQEYRLFGTLSSGEMVFKNFSARLKYQNRHCPGALWDEILRSDNKEMYKEELRRQRQRRLGRRYHRQTAKRLGVIKPPSDDSGESERTISADDETTTDAMKKLRADTMRETQSLRQQKQQLARQNFQPAQLFNVSIHPCVVGGGEGGKNVSGTLEANLDGFRYSNSCVPFEITVMYGDIKYAFTQDGDENKAPFCHLHMHKPIMVGTEMTENIQFHMVQNSDVFDKAQQKSRNDDDNKVMQEFRLKVDRILDPLPVKLTCKWVDKKRGFHGEVHPEDHPPFSAIFVFSCFTLIQLEHTPFTIVTLEEIELVNLVQLGSDTETFNMTIVFKDFKRNVFQINSIPSAKRISIKSSLDLSEVKYYENKLDVQNWRSKLKDIRDEPKKFIQGGGWKFLSLGESANDPDSSGDEYSFGSYSVSSGSIYCSQEEPEQTCESVHKGKEKKELCASHETGNFSDSSMQKFDNLNSFVCDSLVKFDKYSYEEEPCQASDSDPRKKEKKQIPLIQKRWTMAEGKRVMVSSDECDSDPIRKGREIKGPTQTKRSVTSRKRRNLVMAEESDDEE